MQVKQYLFQSPYYSQVQFGRLDASTQKEDNTNSANTQEMPNLDSKNVQNPIQVNNSIESIKPTLDVYA